MPVVRPTSWSGWRLRQQRSVAAYLPMITAPVTLDAFLELVAVDGSTAALTQPGGGPPSAQLDWMMVGPEGLVRA